MRAKQMTKAQDEEGPFRLSHSEFDAIEARVRSGGVSEKELMEIEARPVRTDQERAILNACGRPTMSDQEYQRFKKRIEAEEGVP